MSADLEQHADRLLILSVIGELKKSELDAVQSEFVERIVKPRLVPAGWLGSVKRGLACN
jgi:hypothetical protein